MPSQPVDTPRCVRAEGCSTRWQMSGTPAGPPTASGTCSSARSSALLGAPAAAAASLHHVCSTKNDLRVVDGLLRGLLTVDSKTKLHAGRQRVHLACAKRFCQARAALRVPENPGLTEVLWPLQRCRRRKISQNHLLPVAVWQRLSGHMPSIVTAQPALPQAHGKHDPPSFRVVLTHIRCHQYCHHSCQALPVSGGGVPAQQQHEVAEVLAPCLQSGATGESGRRYSAG